MPIPASYTEETLKTFMLSATGNVGVVLELTTSHFDEAVINVLLSYGVEDIADATEIAKLRALAKVAAWQVAVEQSSGKHNFSSRSSRYEQKTIHDQAVALLMDAENKAAPYMGDVSSNVVGVSGMTYTDDPYLAVIDDDE